MTNTIDYDLKEILMRLDGRFDKLDNKIDRLEGKIDKVAEDLGDFKTKVAEEFGALRSEVTKDNAALRSEVAKDSAALRSEVTKDNAALRSEVTNLREQMNVGFSGFKTDLVRVENSLKGEIEVLAEKVDGITKRIDTQEFINRGVIIGLILAVLGGFAKVFGLTN
jgi:SMC interacting uncharacterized protein involved in chromosome segregation